MRWGVGSGEVVGIAHSDNSPGVTTVRDAKGRAIGAFIENTDRERPLPR